MLVQTFGEVDYFFQVEYYELFVRPAVAVLSPENAEKLMMILEKRSLTKTDGAPFKVSFDGKPYTISREYPCG